MLRLMRKRCTGRSSFIATFRAAIARMLERIPAMAIIGIPTLPAVITASPKCSSQVLPVLLEVEFSVFSIYSELDMMTTL